MRYILLALLAMLLGCSAPDSSQPKFISTDVTGAQIGSDFALTDHNGKLRHLSDFKGKVTMLFFGYTHCPDACPTTMSELAQVVKLLGDKGKDVQVLFITVDPERDSLDILKSYVPAFNPSFIGLRGDDATTHKVAQDFKIYYAKQASNSKAGYTIDHSTGVYVYDKQGQLRLFMTNALKPQDIAHDVGLLM
ncbi:MAG TPA: SCO family protein [Methylophilaceae bacterium]|jgi:protein SCO1/2